MKPLIIGVDFDDTIAYHDDKYNPTKLLPFAKEVINWMYDHNCYIIIWTCRKKKMLKLAIDFLNLNKIKYHKVNENYEDLDMETSRKIYFDVSIDDKNLLPVDWLKIKEMIKQKLIKKLAEEIFKIQIEST